MKIEQKQLWKVTKEYFLAKQANIGIKYPRKTLI